MILPKTPLYQAKTDAEFRIRMIQHIKSAYKDILGKDANLLDLPNGLDIVQAKIQQRLYDISRGEINLLRDEGNEQLAA
ncbi:MAG: hypothetical protein GQF41_1861 [Candidatus Rifleibacterium amylolyticum]|nr:MAG: hypothetical protein GQF41_1861 [Candidatus Rifleibacterium amylolyticum]NLF98499.1 hypothetical protein [Candidatus Riflebacteria bacterium]